jgi:hypothetical protein
MSLSSTEKFFSELCLKKRQTSVQDLIQDLPGEQSQHLKTLGEKRFQVYRNLVFNNISSMIKTALPLFVKNCGEKLTKELVEKFLSSSGIKTSVYTFIPLDFAGHYLNPHQKLIEKTLLKELLDYEITEFRLQLNQNPQEPLTPAPIETSMDQIKVSTNPSLQIKAYEYPVHEMEMDNISEKNHLRDKPCHLAIYRDSLNLNYLPELKGF